MMRLVLGLLVFFALAGGAQAQSCSGTPNANQICAAPNGSSGFPSFRAMVNPDIPAGAANTVKGTLNGTSETDLTATQLTTLCNLVTGSLSGCVPSFPNTVTTFFRGDGTYNVPPTVTSGAPGYVPAFPNNTTSFFRGDGTYAVPLNSAAIDAAFGSIRGSVLERGASGWQIITPGTSGLPWVSNGTGADPAYQALTGGGIASNTVANSNLANMASRTLKCNSTSGSGAPQDCNYPVFNVKDPAYGAACDGITNDTTAINNAISAANTAGGGFVIVPSGTCIASNLTLLTGVTIQGQGEGGTIIKGPASDTHAIFVTQNFASLKGSNTQAGPFHWGIRDMTIDGNKASRTTADNLDLYGYQFELVNLNVINAPNVGIYSEWAVSAGCITTNLCMEARVYNVHVNSSASDGIDWNGPHDSVLVNVIPWLNGGKGIALGESATFSSAGTMLANFHAYANTGVGISSASLPLLGSMVESESNSADGIDISGEFIANGVITFKNAGNGVSITGNQSQISNLWSWGNTGASGNGLSITGNQNNVYGLVASNAQFGVVLNAAAVILDIQGSQNTGGVISFGASESNNFVRVLNFQTAGSAYTGTPNATDVAIVSTSGGAAGANIGQFPAITSPPITTSWGAFTPSPSCGTATITTNAARSKTIGKTTSVEIDLTITALGTCTSALSITLPNTPNSNAVLTGQSVGDSIMLACRVISGNNTPACIKTSGAAYTATTITLSGAYENQ